MSIYTPKPVTEEPVIELIRWRIVQRPNGHCHVLGMRSGADGRISSQIYETAIKDDHIELRTRSGRVYKLLDAPGRDLDAEYVLRVWSQGEETKDVTSEFFHNKQPWKNYE